MARARNIKPGILKNELLGTGDPLAYILFTGLWMLADRDGRLEDRPLRIKAEVFPYRGEVDIGAQLDWLIANGFLDRYEVKGYKVLSINKFLEHQRPHPNEPESELPAHQRSTNGKPKVKSPVIQSVSQSRLLIDSLLIESPSPLPFTSVEFLEALHRWAKHRTEKREALTDSTLRGQLKKMKGWGEPRAIAAIDHSITMGWVGLFEEKKDKQKNAPEGDSESDIRHRDAAARDTDRILREQDERKKHLENQNGQA